MLVVMFPFKRLRLELPKLLTLLITAGLLVVGSQVGARDRQDLRTTPDGKPGILPRKDYIPEYFKLGTGGGRAGLPEVSLYVRKNQARLFWHGAGGWLDDAGTLPKSMNYPGWNFWRVGLWDALMQLVYEQATDPAGGAIKLGRYHVKLRNSKMPCWSERLAAPGGLVLDVSNDVRKSDSFQADKYLVYGKSNRLYFNGTARMHLFIDKNRNVSVEVMQSTMPAAATSNLKAALESLNNHPVISFPVQGPQLDKIDVIVDVSITRSPGELLVARSEK